MYPIRATMFLALSLFALSAGSAGASPEGPRPDRRANVEATFDPNGPHDHGTLAKDPGTAGQPPQVPEPPTEGGDGGTEGGTPPTNDQCTSATVIPGNIGVYNPPIINTTGATNAPCEAGETCEASGAGTSNSVWYVYTPALSGNVEINTFGSNYNTVLSVWPSCGGGNPPLCIFPTEIACNDNASFGTQSQLFLNVTGGNTYRIKVSDYNTTDGGGNLDFNLFWRPHNDLCANATVIPGVAFDAPVYTTTTADTEVCEALESCEVNNVGVSNTVWYTFAAPCDGLISLNTNGSTYDTVLSIWDKCGFFYSVDFPCNYGEPAPAQIACDDDSGTGTQSQLTNVPVTGGQVYLIKVADYNTASGGGLLDFNFMFIGADPPTASITSPSALGCVCGIVDVQGTADAGGAPLTRTLEYQPVGGATWSQISSGTTPVTNGSLGMWDTAGLAQGHYVLRLTVQNSCGLVNTAVAVVFLDAAFDTLTVNAPVNSSLIAGTTCVDGTVWDTCFGSYTVMYRPAGTFSFTPVDAGNPVYNTAVINNPLAGAGWNTTTLTDGNYELRVQAVDQCNHTASVLRTVTVDNTPPFALITSPTPCGSASGTVAVMGTANDAHLAGWSLQYTGGPASGWVTIATGNSPVINGLLGNWNTASLPPCAYTLRLLVTDASVLNCGPLKAQAEYTVSINVGSATSCCDVNHDGLSNGLDVPAFVQCLLNGVCP